MSHCKLVVENLLGQSIAEVALASEAVVIGRDTACQVQLPSPYISIQHASIEPADGGYVIRSFGLNGTYVNQELVKEDEGRPVEVGDVITLPGFTLRLVDEDATPRVDRQTLQLMREFSELKADLHERLLQVADLRTLSGSDLPEEERRSRLQDAVHQILSGPLPIHDALGDFIAAEAIRSTLIDRLVLRGKESPGGGGSPAWQSDPSERALEELLDRICLDLDLDAGGVARGARARAAALSRQFDEVFEQHRSTISPGLKDVLIRRAIRQDLEDLVFGLGPLEDLLKLPDLNEVMVIGRDKVFVEKAGSMEETGRSFPTDDGLQVVIGRIVAPIGRVVNRSQPMVDARLADGSRVNIVIPPVSIRGPAITIRKFRKDPFSIEDLVRLGTLNQRALRFLRACVLARKNLIISGGTGSGKTTLLNTLSSQIPPHERIVVIEDSAELQLQQPNLVVLEAKKANIEGEGEITIRDLVRNALRMRPERIIVGECRGKEALDMLQAMNTGHDGSFTTAHANSPREMISRLEVMVLEAGESLPIPAIHRQIAGALDIIIQIQRRRDRSRKVTHISEVVGYDNDEQEIILEDVFRLYQPVEAEPTLRFTGYLPSFIEDLLDRGDTHLEDLL